ncbi:hypothetical protein [Roseibium sp.]|uniref:hypothetical protein n=1 Tax=Roseibium sp. TaxID=1936156 RepID=UPI003A97DA5A
MSDDTKLSTDRKFPPFAFGPTQHELDASFDNYRDVGQLVFEWATGARPWPENMAAFRKAVGKNMYVPPEYERLRIVQADNGSVQSEPGSNGLEFVLRLPPKGQVSESAKIIRSGLSEYPLPRLYSMFLQEGHGFPAESVFFSRIADYTMRSCR